jgi:hypothetical protein
MFGYHRKESSSSSGSDSTKNTQQVPIGISSVLDTGVMASGTPPPGPPPISQEEQGLTEHQLLERDMDIAWLRSDDYNRRHQ